MVKKEDERNLLPMMTKREFMAMQMMQALLSYPVSGRKPLRDYADRAIEATDILLERLQA